MRFERAIEEDGRRPEFYMVPKRRKGSVSGNAVDGRGAGVTEERGIGIVLSFAPKDAAAILADPTLAKFLLRERRNGSGVINTPIAEHANARIVTGFDEAGLPVTTRRLKGAEFTEHAPQRRLRVGAIPTMLMKILN